MVLSDLSGLPTTVPYLSQTSPTGFDAVGSGLILFALVLLLVGMIGLYAKQSEPRGARVIEYGEGYPRDLIEELQAPEEAPHELVEEGHEALAPRSSRADALVLGTWLLLFFL